MTRTILLAGVAGTILIASVAGATAQIAPDPVQPQTAPPQVAQTAQPAVAQAAPVQAESCSGLSCLFPTRSEQPAAAPPPPPTPADTAQQAATAPADEPDRKVRSAPKPKPVHAVTIAADATEMGRVKALAAAMPKGTVKVVKAEDGKAKQGADFSVSAALDQRGAGEKAKLFTEEMHIVADGSIKSVADLKDKVVSFGPDQGPGQAAARKAFEALNISVKETPLELDNAFDGLATGDVSAVVILAPQPVEKLTKLSGSGLHLVSWPEGGALPEGAVSAKIDASRYPKLVKTDDTINAVGVNAVLSISPKGARQPAAKKFLNVLAQRSASLSKRGFDLLKADLDARGGRRFASDERR